MADNETIRTLTAMYLRRRLARITLRDFVRDGWRIVEPSTPYVHGWHIDAISDHLEAVTAGEIQRLVINVPPKHMKSLTVSVLWPGWVWTFAPEKRWLFASYALSLSKRDSVKCRRLIESPWYRERWGHQFSLTSDQNEKLRFENNRTGYRLATSVGGAATGEGGDFLVIDDGHNANEVESDTTREGVSEWFDSTMSTRLNDPKSGAMVVVMQRLHERDLSGHLLSQGGWEHLCLPAEYEPSPQVSVTKIGWSDPRTEPGELLWPERFGADEIAALKRSLGSYRAAGQLQQRPSPSEGGIFKRHWWRFWHYPDKSLPPVHVRLEDGAIYQCPCVPLPEKFDEQIQSWDMAFKDTKSSDFVVGQAWAKREANRFLLAQKRDRLSFPKTCDAVLAMSEEFPGTTAKLVEDKANGSAVLSTLQSVVEGLIAIEPEGGKEARAHAVSPQVESGNVYLPHPSIAPWIDSFINECAAFPNGANDDQVDSMTQALQRMRTVKPAVIVSPAAMPRVSKWGQAGTQNYDY